jgi:DNA-binding GntR family transcriptional regulator
MKIAKMRVKSIKIIIVKKILKGEYKLKDKINNKVHMKKKLEIKKIKILIV